MSLIERIKKSENLSKEDKQKLIAKIVYQQLVGICFLPSSLTGYNWGDTENEFRWWGRMYKNLECI